MAIGVDLKIINYRFRDTRRRENRDKSKIMANGSSWFELLMVMFMFQHDVVSTSWNHHRFTVEEEAPTSCFVRTNS